MLLVLSLYLDVYKHLWDVEEEKHIRIDFQRSVVSQDERWMTEEGKETA